MAEPDKTQLPDLSSIRKQAEVEMGSLYKDFHVIADRVEWEVFCKAEPEQITMELVTSVLRGDEYKLRGDVNDLLATDPNSTITAWYFNEWCKADDAFKGALGKGSVSKTIDFLREKALCLRNLKGGNLKILELGGPFEGNPFQEVSKLEQQNTAWEHIAENYDTSVRLFENRPAISVSQA